ncbi:MAG: hypothetical protein J6W36_05535 [Clostridiales bacterium]|nr:hypothetical protein [Clostridiales bacterium]
MRKKALVSILVAVMTIVCLAGCSGNGGGFEKSTLVDASRQYGMREAGNSLDTTSLINYTGSIGASFYVSKNKEDAQNLFDRYINNGGNLPGVTVTEAVIVAANEYLGDGNYQTLVYQLTLKDSSSAKELYSAFADSYVSKDSYTSGKKNGYHYTISYFGGDVQIHKRGAYLKGNSVLFIYGLTTRTEDRTGFAKYIFNAVHVVDPEAVN